MAVILVRRLDDDIKVRLKRRAKRHGRSLEAESRAILEDAALAEVSTENEAGRIGLGSLMRRRFGRIGLTKEESRAFNKAIDDLRGRSKPRDPGFRS